MIILLSFGVGAVIIGVLFQIWLPYWVFMGLGVVGLVSWSIKLAQKILK